jgi:hypothetical protein
MNHRKITVAGRDVTDIEIRIPQRKRIYGRIAVEGTDPQPGFKFIITGPCSMVVNVATGPDGTFNLCLPVGEYWISVTGTASGYVVSSLTYGSTNLLDEPLRVTDVETAELRVALVVTASLNTVSLSGRVIGPKSAGSDDVSLVTPRRISIVGATVQDRLLGLDGEFEFRNVPPTFHDFELVLGSYSSRARISPHRDLANLTLLAVSGQVEADSGSIPSSLPIHIQVGIGPEHSPVEFTPRDIRLQTDGSFTLILIPGKWEVVVIGRRLPANTIVKSILYGSADALNQPLTIGLNDPISDLRIRIGLID